MFDFFLKKREAIKEANKVGANKVAIFRLLSNIRKS